MSSRSKELCSFVSMIGKILLLAFFYTFWPLKSLVSTPKCADLQLVSRNFDISHYFYCRILLVFCHILNLDRTCSAKMMVSLRLSWIVPRKIKAHNSCWYPNDELDDPWQIVKKLSKLPLSYQLCSRDCAIPESQCNQF